jgi:hypothetical protein
MAYAFGGQCQPYTGNQVWQIHPCPPKTKTTWCHIHEFKPQKKPAWNLTIMGLTLAGILAIFSLGHAEQLTHI